ncbi:hypothetical protein [Thermoleptolyngbya sp. C42_A2020_037]|uniref:hypothetical protein n=1 Tax=Thermoleptolyngbya sp. C42_A2020_037 TaxID=2747799 RepID=UPI0019F3C711|nr:hypothetical protein [Thermoleptolyngbya sp. C42_A2020_037]MBF2084171.1 hypothetical protein [Thermoleptolyngbya sp. C42_A2020_037]
MSAIDLFSAVLSGASLLNLPSDLGALPLGMVHSAAMHSAIAPSHLTTFGAIGDFSRAHCLAICAVLVPANLLATLQTLIFVGCNRSCSAIRWITSAASVYAILMLMHVLTWFVVGVVMPPTFVLTGLGGLCLGLNAWAIARPQSLSGFLRRLVGWGYALLPKRFPTVSSLPVLPEQG